MTSLVLDNKPLDIIGNTFLVSSPLVSSAESDGTWYVLIGGTFVFPGSQLFLADTHSRARDARIVMEIRLELRCLLKDHHHHHTVRYHNRYVDTGISHIFMEYCGGGDLSTIIYYFLQFYTIATILTIIADQGAGPGLSIIGTPIDAEGGSRRVQILHCDLKFKPDNGSSSSTAPCISRREKLTDVGLSKALAQASFVSTYVGVRHCRGPIPACTHLILKDSILKPPSPRAKTRSELCIFIRCVRFCISFFRSHCLFVG